MRTIKDSPILWIAILIKWGKWFAICFTIQLSNIVIQSLIFYVVVQQISIEFGQGK